MKMQIRFRRLKIGNPEQLATGVAKWTAITVCGILLFKLGQAVAYAQRGYIAIGGEIFLLLLPLFWRLMETAIKEGVAFEPRSKER
jgi:hypothetical protein